MQAPGSSVNLLDLPARTVSALIVIGNEMGKIHDAEFKKNRPKENKPDIGKMK